jgi:hypothetical protein
MAWSTIQTTKYYYEDEIRTNISLCPVFEPGTKQIVTESGEMYFNLKKKVVCLRNHGVIVEWHTKPTLKEAVNNKRKGCYYEFGMDTSVIYSFIDDDGVKQRMEWSPPAFDQFTCGSPLLGYFDAYTNTYYEPNPCRNCGSECEGCDYEKYSLCSRSCMVEYSSDR